jgi:hypothetical protein
MTRSNDIRVLVDHHDPVLAAGVVATLQVAGRFAIARRRSLLLDNATPALQPELSQAAWGRRARAPPDRHVSDRGACTVDSLRGSSSYRGVPPDWISTHYRGRDVLEPLFPGLLAFGPDAGYVSTHDDSIKPGGTERLSYKPMTSAIPTCSASAIYRVRY